MVRPLRIPSVPEIRSRSKSRIVERHTKTRLPEPLPEAIPEMNPCGVSVLLVPERILGRLGAGSETPYAVIN